MRWLCWFLPHKWIESITPEYMQCERCPKVRPRSAEERLPKGTRACPYPGCDGWVVPPPTASFTNDKGGTSFYTRYTTECQQNESHRVRWERDRKTKWPDPIAIGNSEK